MPAKRSKKRWVAKVKTDSTHPPAGLFTKHATQLKRDAVPKPCRTIDGGCCNKMTVMTESGADGVALVTAKNCNLRAA